jgi:hypothetical protein
MDFFTNRITNITKKVEKKKHKSLDIEVVEHLKPLAERLGLDVEELCLNLHAQGIYIFDEIEDVLGVEEI